MIETSVCTVKVDGDVDDTRVLVVSDKYLPISFILYTPRLNRWWNRTVAPVETSTTTNTLSDCWPQHVKRA